MKTTTYRAVTARLGDFIKVHMNVANAIEIYFTNGIVYTSYDAVVAILIYGDRFFYTRYHDYSKTTSLHMIKMTQTTKADRIRALNDGYATFIDDYERP